MSLIGNWIRDGHGLLAAANVAFATGHVRALKAAAREYARFTGWRRDPSYGSYADGVSPDDLIRVIERLRDGKAHPSEVERALDALRNS